MNTLNTLPDKYYLSQRNNRLKPSIACNVTAMTMGLFQAGYNPMKNRDTYNKTTGNNFLQPEDALMSYIQQDKYRQLAEGDLAEWKENPEQSFTALVAGTNDFMGNDIYFLDWSESKTAIKNKIYAGYGVVICGNFPGTKGHFVNVGGYDDDCFIINDPWGGYGDKLFFDKFDKIIYNSGIDKFWVFYARPNK